MNIRTYLILILALLAAQPSLAQSLIPATNEDISAFDRKLEAQLKKSKSDVKKANFGSEVSSEAKKISDGSADQGREFGQWVSGQRKKEDQGRPSAQGASSAAASAGKSADRGSSAGKGKKK